MPPILFFTGSPLRSGAIPNYVWQTNPQGPWGWSIRVLDPTTGKTRILFEERDSVILDMSAADKRIVYEWLDAMIPYYPTFDYAHIGGKGDRDKWGAPDSTALKPWFTKRFAPLYAKDIAHEAAREAWRTPEADMPGFVPFSRGRYEYRP